MLYGLVNISIFGKKKLKFKHFYRLDLKFNLSLIIKHNNKI